MVLGACLSMLSVGCGCSDLVRSLQGDSRGTNDTALRSSHTGKRGYNSSKYIYSHCLSPCACRTNRQLRHASARRRGQTVSHATFSRVRHCLMSDRLVRSNAGAFRRWIYSQEKDRGGNGHPIIATRTILRPRHYAVTGFPSTMYRT